MMALLNPGAFSKSRVLLMHGVYHELRGGRCSGLPPRLDPGSS